MKQIYLGILYTRRNRSKKESYKINTHDTTFTDTRGFKIRGVTTIIFHSGNLSLIQCSHFGNTYLNHRDIFTDLSLGSGEGETLVCRSYVVDTRSISRDWSIT